MDTLPRIKGIKTLPNYRLSVVFDDGKEVVYDVGEDIEQVDEFRTAVPVYIGTTA